MKWGVWCVCYGGMTGHRESWQKANGVREEFDTREAAEAALQRLDESRIAAKQPMYGSYAIKKLRRHP